MSNIIVDRWYRPKSTVGIFTVQNFSCFSLELPDLENQTGISCIPEGTYNYFSRYSPGNKSQVIQLLEVPNRSYVQVHAGNFTRQIRGCILVGDAIKFIDGDEIPDVSNSKNTLVKVLDLAGDTGTITVRS